MTDQLHLNKKAYQKIKDDMEAKNFGRVALMHDGKVIHVLNDSGDAYTVGVAEYGLGNFYIQRIGDKPIDLGIHGLFVH